MVKGTSEWQKGQAGGSRFRRRKEWNFEDYKLGILKF